MNTSFPQNASDTAFEVKAGERVAVPVIEEEIHVETRTVETGVVQVHKTVQERQQIVDPPLLRETVTVHTVEINRVIDGPPPTDRQEGNTLIIPVLEEVLVTEKRLLLKSEIHIRRVQETFHAPQTVTLRSEAVTVERHEVPEASVSPDASTEPPV